MANRLIIIGAGGHGKVCADIALKMGKWNEVAFLDDNEELTTVLGLQVLDRANVYPLYKKDTDFFIAIGNNTTRELLLNKLIDDEYNISTLIHPNSVIAKEVEIGIGSVVMAGTVINCSTKIGKGCIINTSSSIDHDCIIEDYVHISPGVRLAGNVRVGNKCWLGIGSTVINNISICDECIIGAGGLVISQLVIPATYIGCPVKMSW
ncbi:MAG TPA: acetyltransferase [Bacteroidales bacterium]|nr:acetyltransferase [Bacteroidales bacterium]